MDQAEPVKLFIDVGKVVEMGPAKKMFTTPEHEKTRLYAEGRMISIRK